MGSQASRRGASPPPPLVRAVLDDLRLLVRELRVSSKAAEKTLRISGAQLFVLQCLSENEPSSMRELAERTHTDQSSVSVVVGRLAESKLVRRAPSLDDARRVEVRLTERGRKVARSAPEATQVRLTRALIALPAPVRKQLASGLSELVRQMGLIGAPRMFFEDDPKPTRKPRARKTSRLV